MVRYFFAAVFVLIFSGVNGQPDFAIVGSDGQEMPDQVTLISGMSLQLTTNFSLLGVEYVSFENDESYSNEGPFPIGFNFQFYSQNPAVFQVASTGFINFGPYGLPIRFQNQPIPFPNLSHFRNSIYGCFMPWNPVEGQFVKIYRLNLDKIVIEWCDCPLRNAAGQPLTTGTFQIVIYSNDDIDIHLIEIPRNELNNGLATVGILEANRILHAYPPNRNNFAWTPLDQPESWNFSPDQNHIEYLVTPIIPPTPVLIPEYITWHELDAAGNDIREIGSDFNITLTPRNPVNYYRAVLRTCWGEEIERDEITINVAGTFPNAFNPNSSSPNNEFKMILNPGLPVNDFRLQIYNRWGQLVFETTEYKEGWNGKMFNNGKDCPMGVYNWILLIETDRKSKVTNTGSVMLLR